jgi:hypothetical protein
MRTFDERLTDEFMDWKTAFLLGLVVFVAIRVPHDKRSKETEIAGHVRVGDHPGATLFPDPSASFAGA